MRQARNKMNYEMERIERQFEELEETLYRAKPEEERARNEEVPPVAEVFEHATRLGPMLWTRRPEHWNFLALRLGTGRAPSRHSIAHRDAEGVRPEHVARVHPTQGRH